MQLASKQVQCLCGNTSELTTKRALCIKCGKYVFYSQEEKRSYQRHKIYVGIILASGLGLFAYFVVEMILIPFFPR
jgi:hypothetical protein